MSVCIQYAQFSRTVQIVFLETGFSSSTKAYQKKIKLDEASRINWRAEYVIASELKVIK